MNPQPLICVADVAKSANWYQRVLGFSSAHGGAEYDRLNAPNGQLVLQLHRWGAHDHPHIGDEAKTPHGNGVVLWFQTDDIDAVWTQASTQNAHTLHALQINNSANHREFWLRDPDGYVVVVAGQYGDV